MELDVDVFMTYESSAEAYLAASEDSIHPMSEYEGQPSTRFWHVIHSVTQDNYQEVFAKADSIGVSHLYVTDGQLVEGAGGQWQPDVNPYENPPSKWISDLIKPWIKGNLDLYQKVTTLEMFTSGLADSIRAAAESKNSLVGTGQPEGVVSAPVGTIYCDTAVTAGAKLWIKTVGSDSNGRVVLVGDTGWRKVTYNPTVLTNGIPAVRRTEKGVFFAIINGTWGACKLQNGSGKLYVTAANAVPDGFVPAAKAIGTVYSDDGLYSGALIVAGVSDARGVQIRTSGVSSTVFYHTPQLFYNTNDPWPTTLPGQAV